MKVSQILSEVDRGDLELAHSVAARQQIADDRNAHAKGVWLVNRKTNKKLSGPFRDDDTAVRFKQNRPDKIPADARIVHI